MDKKSYKMSFSSNINLLNKEKTKENFAQANLQNLIPLMPSNIDFENNPDLIGIVLNSAVGNLANKNFHCISNKDLVSIAKNFVYKLVDIEHNRKNCVGFICNYGFSKFEGGEVITEEAAADSTDPVNLSLAAIIWESTLEDSYEDILENCDDPQSQYYNAISASWEIMFSDYDIAVGPTFNLADCKIFSGEDKAVYEQYLPQNGGKGSFNGEYVFMLAKVTAEDWVLPMGIGLVENPAAFVKGLVIVNPEPPETEDGPEEEDDKMKDMSPNSPSDMPTCNDSEAKISNNNNNSVKIDNKTNSITSERMKFTNIKDLTDTSIKEALASDVHELFEQAAREANQKYTKAKTLSETLKAANEKLA
ncbi:hypothetical protein CCP3SC5AM1_2170002 [Gammaproteobacteria bacterium]